MVCSRYHSSKSRDLLIMQRRLSIAISFCGAPRIVFLDEPTTGLDPLSRKELWRVLLRARRRRAAGPRPRGMGENGTGMALKHWQ